MTLALFFTSLGVYFFMIPSGIVVGSISGLAMVLAQLSGLSISVITMILNVGLLSHRLYIYWKGIWCKNGLYIIIISSISRLL